ncbi:hypothetical protein GGI43DRAFT_384071 [Trichoderma evansii]
MKASFALLAATCASSALATSLGGINPEVDACDVVYGDFKRTGAYAIKTEAQAHLTQAHLNNDTEEDDEIIIPDAGQGKGDGKGKRKGGGKANEQICFPGTGQNNNIPQSITDLDAQVKIDWAIKLCSQINFSSVDAQSVTTDLADGIDATENGKTYGLNLITVAVPDEQPCVSNAAAVFMADVCPSGGAFIDLESDQEEWFTIVVLN